MTTARFNLPWGLATDASGVLYVADTFNHVIRRISTSGVVTESDEFIHSFPQGITAGKGGQVWFLGTGNNRLYQTVVPR